MKWIGQNIYDQISRFRNDTYFEKDVYFQGDTVTFTSANADDPAVIIENTRADAEAARLQFKKHRGVDAVDGDSIGEIEFWGYDDGTPSTQMYGKILTEIHDATSGQESGTMYLSVASHDGGINTGLKLTGGSVNNEVDVEIGRGGGSVTDVQGTLSMGGTATINNSGVIQVAAQTVIDHDQLANFAANEHYTQNTITTVGTIGAGVWQGTRIASAYLDSDTAHLTTDQTFTGNKTFNQTIIGNINGSAATVATIAGLAPNTATTQATQGNITSCANLATVGTVTTGSWRATQVQIISANFKDNQGTTETFLPLSAQPEEKTSFGNEQTLLLMPTGGNVKEIIVRANYNAYTSENIVFKVYTRAANKKVNGSSQVGSDVTVAAPTQNATDSNNTRSTGEITHAYVAGDMLGISMTHQSTGPVNSNDKTYVTVVLENDLSDLGY